MLANKFLRDPKAECASFYAYPVSSGSAFPAPMALLFCSILYGDMKKRDGTPQTWNMNGGDDLQQKYDELDYRFKQTIGCNQCYWNAPACR